jgi:hypothetical protein
MSYKIPAVPHATYSSALTQTVASTSTAYPVIFESADDQQGIYHTSGTFTAVAATNVVTVTGFTPADGMVVFLTTTTTLPDPLAASTAYYIISSSGQTCKFSTSLGGSEVDITDTGTGTHTATVVSRFYVPETGDYLVQISIIIDSTSASGSMDIWFDINGTNVAKSNTICFVDGTVMSTVAVPIILDLNKGDYVRLFYRGSTNNMRLLATAAAATPTRPACPSVLMTINKIGM